MFFFFLVMFFLPAFLRCTSNNVIELPEDCFEPEELDNKEEGEAEDGGVSQVRRGLQAEFVKEFAPYRKNINEGRKDNAEEHKQEGKDDLTRDEPFLAPFHAKVRALTQEPRYVKERWADLVGQKDDWHKVTPSRHKINSILRRAYDVVHKVHCFVTRWECKE